MLLNLNTPKRTSDCSVLFFTTVSEVGTKGSQEAIGSGSLPGLWLPADGVKLISSGVDRWREPLSLQFTSNWCPFSRVHTHSQACQSPVLSPHGSLRCTLPPFIPLTWKLEIESNNFHFSIVF
ncbi:uncharacterized protein [Physcomitrium patens]|uniref:uncharacterized protein n=1 Tax=Physcomitrium patens TaxID=3218 RepID=UPI003CCE372E